jgi:uncharacterized protein YodC (DUF2158 family)
MSLQQGMFKEQDLIAVYALPNLHSVMPGNEVMLRSGGPNMIVSDVAENGDAICKWEADGVLHTHAFSLLCLTCYGAK